MTTQDLDGIDQALRAFVIHRGYSTGARNAALRFNSQVEEERSRLKDALVTHERAGLIAPEVEIELRALAVMYREERARVVRVWNIPSHAPPDLSTQDRPLWFAKPASPSAESQSR